LQGAVNGAIGIINGLIESFNNGIGQITGQIPKLQEVAWTTQKSLADANTAMQNSTTTVTGGIVTAVTKMTADIKKTMEAQAPTMYDPMKSATADLRDKVVKAANTVINSIKAMLGAMDKASNAGVNTPAAPASPKPAGARALGGPVNEGWWYLHDNEYVLSAAMRAGRDAIPKEAVTGLAAPQAGQPQGAAPSTDLNELVALLRSMPRDMARAVRDGLIQAQA
jgi:hypothetical protein